MIQLLTTVVIVEAIVAVVFSIDLPPISKVVKRINYVSSSRISAIVGTLAGTMFVILGSSINSIMKIQGRSRELGAVSPTDQILMKTHMLEASLMGYALLLGLLIDRLHYFVRRVDTLKKEVKTFRSPLTEEKEKGKSSSSKMKVLKDEIVELRQKLQKLSLDSETMEKQAKSAEANAKALEEQAHSFLVKYDNLEEDNQKLQSEISALKKTSSNVHSKKDA